MTGKTIDPGSRLQSIAQPAEVLQALQQAVGSETTSRKAPGSWKQWLTPSFSDCLFISLIVLLFFSNADGWSRLLLDGDTGWHIRTGEWILSHGSVPRWDLFSFSKPGQPWYAWEWLTDVIYAGLHGWLGLKGIVLLGGIQIALFGTLLVRFLEWRGANILVALPVGLLAIGASSIHYLARPHLFTLVFLVASLWVLEADRRKPSRAVWCLVPLTVVWTNLHGGFLTLLACLGLLTIGSLAEDWMHGRQDRWTRAGRYGLLTALCGAASLVNPYGLELHRHIAAYLRSDWIREAIQEFQSPSFRNENILQFEALLLVGLMVAASMLGRGRIVEPLWILLWAHQALGSVRHVTVYVTVAAPLIATELSRWWSVWVSTAAPRSTRRILDSLARDRADGFRRTSVWPIAFVLLLILVDKPVRWPRDFPDLKFPIGIITRNTDKIVGARILTEDQWADYLIYRFYPRVQVYVDGRSDFYAAELGREYLGLMHGRHDWREILDKRAFTVALIPASWPLASLLKQHPAWRVIEDDGKAVLLVRDRLVARERRRVDSDGTLLPNNLAGGVARSMPDDRPNGNSPFNRTFLRRPQPMKAGKGAPPAYSARGKGNSNAKSPNARDEAGRSTRISGDAGARRDESWKLPSGQDLVEFALRAGFVAPGLMRENDDEKTGELRRTEEMV